MLSNTSNDMHTPPDVFVCLFWPTSTEPWLYVLRKHTQSTKHCYETIAIGGVAMFWRIVLAPFVVGMLVGAAVHGPSPQVLAQQAPTLEAPKWDLGDRWTWQSGKDEITLTVVGTSGGYAVQQKIGSKTSTYHYNTDFSSKDVHFSQFQFPLNVGKEWTYTIEGIAPNGQPAKWTIKRKVEGMESVTVPAGTFDAVRISGHHCNVTNGYCGDFVTWYAPKVRNVARITTTNSDYWPAYIRGTNQLLVSYELHNP